MKQSQRRKFDDLLAEVVSGLPERVKRLVERVPVVVDDAPEEALVQQLLAEGVIEDAAEAMELMGLHTPPMPGFGGGVGGEVLDGVDEEESGGGMVHLFREAIVEHAGGWGGEGEGDEVAEAERAVREEIRVTLLHEIGHVYGLDEDDLEELGYG